MSLAEGYAYILWLPVQGLLGCRVAYMVVVCLLVCTKVADSDPPVAMETGSSALYPRLTVGT